MAVNEMKTPTIKAVLFDFMGTCLDWHSSVVSALPPQLPEKIKSDLAIEWRHRYFDANAARIRDGEPPEDIDVTNLRVLNEVLETYDDIRSMFSEADKARAVASYHNQKAWDDVGPAIQRLREDCELEVFVHANGTTRLQLDIVKSSGLKFDMLFSSELLGVYKPAPENYEKALHLIRHKPEECVTVAAHAYDVRGAKQAGMRTVYIYRWTDDVNEDHEKLKTEFDAYLPDMSNLAETILAL